MKPGRVRYMFSESLLGPILVHKVASFIFSYKNYNEPWTLMDSNPRQGTYPGCWFHPHSGHVWEATDLSLSFPSSLSINKNILRWGFFKKKKRENYNQKSEWGLDLVTSMTLYWSSPVWKVMGGGGVLGCIFQRKRTYKRNVCVFYIPMVCV